MTTGDKHLIGVINKYYKVPISIDDQSIQPLLRRIRNWAWGYLNDIKISGSTAKDTIIDGNSDLDLFISLRHDLNWTLKDIYNDLYKSITGEGFNARKQNVSIGTTYNGLKVDLIPGKQQRPNSNNHNIYIRKKDSWTLTNIDTHINKTLNSGRLNEIRLTKIWRRNFGVEFSSIYLELTVIEALKNKNKNQLAINFLTVLEYLRDDFVSKIIIDPANTNNRISDELTVKEKEAIAKAAKESRAERYWEDTVW